MVVTAMTQEKPGELLTGLAQTADGRKTRTYEIADRLMSLIGNPVAAICVWIGRQSARAWWLR
jgi:hypothetical protein